MQQYCKYFSSIAQLIAKSGTVKHHLRDSLLRAGRDQIRKITPSVGQVDLKVYLPSTKSYLPIM